MDRVASAELLASLAEVIDTALVVVDADLAVVHWNAAMERLTGLERAAARGRPLQGLTPVLEEVGLPGQLRRALDGEVRYGAEQSSGAAYEARCLPLHDGEGRLLGAAALLGDVSDRRRRLAFLRAMEAVGRSLASSLDLNEVLDTIVGSTLEVMGADSALVASWDGRASEFRVLRASGRLSEHYVADGSIPAGGGPISRAILDGRPMTTANILTDPRVWLSDGRRAQVQREGFKAVAAAPLASKGRVHGALTVQYWDERHVSEEETRALVMLAEQAAIAIDNARLYADATRRAARLRELAEVERLVAGSLDLDDVLRRIAEATARLVSAPVVHLWTAEPGTRTLRLHARSIAAGLPEVEMAPTCAFGEGISGAAAERRFPIFVADAAKDPRVRAAGWWREAGLGTILAVPILAGDSLLGVLTVRARPGALAEEEDRALVTSLAARAALAMQNARTYEEAVRRGARLGELAAVSQSISASLEAADVMQRIVDAAAAMEPGALAAVHELDPARGVLRFAACSSPELRTLPDEHSADIGLPGLVLEARLPVLVPEPLAHPRTSAPEWWRQRPRAGYYGVPIVVGDTFVGVLDYIAPDRVPGAESQEALRLLAAHAGIAIRNASLYQAERAQAGRVSLLAAMNQRISGALDLDELLPMIAESAASLAGVRHALFWLADDEQRTLSVRWGSSSGLAEDFPESAAPYEVGAVGWVARHRVPLVIDDVTADSRITHPDWWRRWGISTFAGYPVMAGEALLAVLVLCHAEPIRFSEETRDAVGMFIAQASVALQNARLFLEARRRRDVAEALARLGRELAATLDIEPIADLVARGIVELLHGKGSAVYRYEPEDGTLHAITSFGGATIPAGFVLAEGEGIAGLAVAERRIVATANVLQESNVQLSDGLRRTIEEQAYRAVVGVPLVVRDRVVGALAMGAEPGRTFSADDLEVLQAFADQAALAFENAGLYASARDSLARLRETQARLVQAGKMSALGQLVSGVAHELNNPLSVIIGYGQLLLTRDIPDPMKRPVQLMVQQGDRMAKIVRNLLYFARQRPPERAAVDLNLVIERTLALRLNQLTLSGITVERDLDPDLPRVMGDFQQLQQVLLNLALNAEQAIGGEGRSGRLLFRTRPGADGRTVRVEVEDDGPGIPTDVLPRVFEPFFTTKEVGTGTGLGLSVSYGIVEEHGGRLSVESHPGRTTFTLELPVASRVDASAATPPPARGPAFGHGRVALIVEDEPSVIDLVLALLRESGWRVDVAPGGRLGLQRVRERRYDLIVSDIRMLDGDGEEFYHRAVLEDRTLASRFIFMTGDTANGHAWSFLREASLPMIEKPFSPDAFLEAVRLVVTSLTESGQRA